MKYITYYLGAGASALSIPMYSGGKFKERFESFLTLFSDQRILQELIADEKSVVKRINEIITFLQSSNVDFNTIDKMAKAYHYQNKFAELKMLKKLMILFLISEQNYKGPFNQSATLPKDSPSKLIDTRYEDLVPQILDTNGSKNVQANILSWNYDMQIE